MRRPHGVRGDALVEVYTSFPERLQPGVEVYLGEAHLPVKISRRRTHNEGLLLAFESITSPEQMGLYRNQVLYTSRTKAQKLGKGEFYQFELLGLQVEDEAGNALGKVTDVMETGANDVYEVTDESGREILLPAIPEVILDINLEQNKMRVHLLPGLLDEAGE